MANHLPLLLPQLCFLLLLAAIATKAQVPANQTFHFVNNVEFGDRIIEYDASYRVIRDNVHNFYNHPFRLCFYNTTPDSFILAMRAGIPNDESLMRWVWDANRNDPVRENATLTFGRDGNFVLADSDGRLVWQTNTKNRGVTGIKMLPNGNLVLHDKNGKFIWQSFDFPTDTLLVGQSIRIGGRNKLISRKSEIDGSDGRFSLVLDRTGLTMFLNDSNHLLPYGGWTETDHGNLVTFAAEPEQENATAYELLLLVNQNTPRRRLLQVRKSRSGGALNLNKLNYNATLSFLRLTHDGNLKAFTYFDPVDYLKWEESFAFFSSYFISECRLPTKCGDYGYCSRAMCVACPTQKGLLGWSEECAPPKTPPCGGGGKIGYYKIVGVEHFMNPYKDDGEGPIRVGDCRAKCNGDCKCLGFIYKGNSKKCLRVPVLGTLIKVTNSSSVAYVKYSL